MGHHDGHRVERVSAKLAGSGSFRRVRERIARLLCVYFRVEAQGMRNIPRSGGAVIIANHSGYLGLDAVILAYLIRIHTGRRPRIMAHRGYFEWFDWLRGLSFSAGLREPRLAKAVETLKRGHLLIVFPEGEAGNFKSSLKKYQLQRFHSGFAFLANRAQVPILPCLVLGAEEAHFNLGSIDLKRLLPGLRIPLPLNLLPLPSKWRVEFFEPIRVERWMRAKKPATSRYTQAAESIRRAMQVALAKELRRRRRQAA